MPDDPDAPFPPPPPKVPYELDANDRRLLKRLGIAYEPPRPDALPMNPQSNPRRTPEPEDDGA